MTANEDMVSWGAGVGGRVAVTGSSVVEFLSLFVPHKPLVPRKCLPHSRCSVTFDAEINELINQSLFSRK